MTNLLKRNFTITILRTISHARPPTRQSQSSQWAGGCALNVNTGASRLGLSIEEAAALVPRGHSLDHGITLLMSRLDKGDRRAVVDN